MPVRHRKLDLSRVIALLIPAAAVAACLDARPEASSRTPLCSSCHGSADREGTAIAQAAPPSDIDGNTDTSAPGVGAHLNHVEAGPDHVAILCTQCHVMPEDTQSPGHIDSPPPAEVVFGSLAQTGGRQPTYDPTTHTCTDTYCHGSAVVTWTEPRSSANACGTCHGLPPPPPHASSTECSLCHSTVIDENREFVAPQLHVNGAVTASNCSECHGTVESPAPPPATTGETDTSVVAVGAHQAHVQGDPTFSAVACADCHVVPASETDPGHIDDQPGAEVTFSGAALAGGASPSWDPATQTCTGTWCHGPSAPAASVSPLWTSSLGDADCTACHGQPPGLPHPASADCAPCHQNINADNTTFLRPDLHVDGTVTTVLP